MLWNVQKKRAILKNSPWFQNPEAFSSRIQARSITQRPNCYSVTKSCLTLCDPMDCSTPGSPVPHYLPEFAQIHVCCWWCYLTISSSAAPLLLFPSIRVFPRLALHIRWPKQWSFSFSINPPNEYSGLISFSIDWFDLLAVQGTLKNLLQQHGSKASIVQCSAFFYCGHFINTLYIFQLQFFFGPWCFSHCSSKSFHYFTSSGCFYLRKQHWIPALFLEFSLVLTQCLSLL